MVGVSSILDLFNLKEPGPHPNGNIQQASDCASSPGERSELEPSKLSGVGNPWHTDGNRSWSGIGSERNSSEESVEGREEVTCVGLQEASKGGQRRKGGEGPSPARRWECGMPPNRPQSLRLKSNPWTPQLGALGGWAEIETYSSSNTESSA